MGKLTVLNHPLVYDKLARLRDKRTKSKEFKELAEELSIIVFYEASRDLKTKNISVKTPVAEGLFPVLENNDFAIVPVLRAGIGMTEGCLKLVPSARVGYLGMYRNETTLEPVEYYCKLPKHIERMNVFLIDPMLATGGTAIAALSLLTMHGCRGIRLLSVNAAPEGVKAVQEAFPDVDIYTCALDDHLNENGYIVPGLGDAGDRLFGTV